MIEKIKKIKKELEGKVLIPAHHYQIPEIVALADFVGDSYKLAVDSSKIDKEYIVFCGVKFMAEGAAILSSAKQKILLPEISAGCPLADFINKEKMEKALKLISTKIEEPIIPVVYMNSYSDTKDVCGKFGGSVCTSSNAAKIVEYFFQQNKSVFFAPDYNLGINIAIEMKLPNENIIKVNKNISLHTDKFPPSPKLFIWDGNCLVHKRFTMSDVQDFRKKYPLGKLIVHPECDKEIVESSDVSGSTAKIYNSIKDSHSSSVWGVGTEYHFVERIAAEFPDKIVVPLRKSICYNMAQITLENLYETLLSIKQNFDGKKPLRNLITVNKSDIINAKKALNKMIAIVER